MTAASARRATVRADETMTLDEYRAFTRKRSKYGNTRSTVDGVTFDSQREVNRYCELKLMEAAGLITNLRAHPPALIIEPKAKDGRRTLRAVKYHPDFDYDELVVGHVVEDVKATVTRTAVFQLKWRLLKGRFPNITFRIVE